jgi:hypothetical protein
MLSRWTNIQGYYQPFNDRALNRDLETLCAKAVQEQPRLPDGRRLLFKMQGAGPEQSHLNFGTQARSFAAMKSL